MLAISHRLKKKEFESVFKKGRGIRSDILYLKLLENDSDDNKIGFVVSKKVSNKAVARNKIKRRLRDIVGRKLKNKDGFLAIKRGVDIILTARPGIEKKSFLEIKSAMEDIFSKARISEKKI
ncbi:ribonuclease P protein component [Candidatus Parcubacteria bacterium A4]|nr:MAG: ribonuclease P protein component [Candidatus Parcubacteria bacterium A4]